MPGHTFSPDPYVQALAKRLRAARDATGINVSSAAKLMGMTPNRASALENGLTEPKAKDVALWARLTGADPLVLLYGEDLADREPIPIPDDPAMRLVSRGSAGRARAMQKRRETATRKTQPVSRSQPTERPLWRPAAPGWQ